MKRFKIILTLLMMLSISACQTQLSAKLIAPEQDSNLSWNEIINRIQKGKITFAKLSYAEAQVIQKSFMEYLSQGKNTSQLEYFISRLDAMEKNEEAKRLAYKLNIHLSLFEKDYESAEAYLLKWIEGFPEDGAAKLRLGILYVEGGKFSKAISFLEAVKDDPRAVVGLVTSHRLLEENDRVDVLCNKYRDEWPDNWQLSYNCALFEEQNMKAPATALKQIEEAVKRLKPGNTEAKTKLEGLAKRIQENAPQSEEP